MVLQGNPENPISPHAISSMSYHGLYFTLPDTPRNQGKVMICLCLCVKPLLNMTRFCCTTFCLVWLYKTYSLLVCAQRKKSYSNLNTESVCRDLFSATGYWSTEGLARKKKDVLVCFPGLPQQNTIDWVAYTTEMCYSSGG